MAWKNMEYMLINPILHRFRFFTDFFVNFLLNLQYTEYH